MSGRPLSWCASLPLTLQMHIPDDDITWALGAPSAASTETRFLHHDGSREHLPHQKFNSQATEWPSVADVSTFTDLNDFQHDGQAVLQELSSPPPSAPIQLLWTPRGIISCNGRPVQLHYDPSAFSTPPTATFPGHAFSTPRPIRNEAAHPHEPCGPRLQFPTDHFDTLPHSHINHVKDPVLAFDAEGRLASGPCSQPARDQAIEDDLSDAQSLASVEDHVRVEASYPIIDLGPARSAAEVTAHVYDLQEMPEEDAPDSHCNFSVADDLSQGTAQSTCSGSRGGVESPSKITDSDTGCTSGSLHGLCGSGLGSAEVTCSAGVVEDEMVKTAHDPDRQSRRWIPPQTEFLPSISIDDQPRAPAAPSAPPKRGTEPAAHPEAPAPHTPFPRPGMPPTSFSTQVPGRHSEDAIASPKRSFNRSQEGNFTRPSKRNVRSATLPEVLKSDIGETGSADDYGSEDELLLWPGGAEAAAAMVSGAMSTTSGLAMQRMDEPGQVVCSERRVRGVSLHGSRRYAHARSHQHCFLEALPRHATRSAYICHLGRLSSDDLRSGRT